MQRADQLEAAKNDADYWTAIVEKLKCFTSIESAEMYGLWYSRWVSPSLQTRSPLTRLWNPIHLYPVYFSYRDESSWSPISSDGSAEFGILNRLIQGLPRRIKKLATHRMHIPVTALNPEAEVLAGSLLNGFRDYDQLRTLNLVIQDRRFLADETLVEISSLSKLLRATTQLKHLGLNLPGKTTTRGLCYTIRDIFHLGHHELWPDLHSLDLGNLGVDAVRWIALLVFSMPNLRSLTIFNIELRAVDWPALVECMHRSLSLSTFKIRRGPGLRNDDHTVISTWDTPHITEDEWGTEEHHGFLDKIEHYVVHGGRNPFLQTHQPDHALIDASNSLYASARRVRPRMMNRIGLRSEMSVNA